MYIETDARYHGRAALPQFLTPAQRPTWATILETVAREAGRPFDLADGHDVYRALELAYAQDRAIYDTLSPLLTVECRQCGCRVLPDGMAGHVRLHNR